MPDTNMLNGISLNTANNISVINLYLYKKEQQNNLLSFHKNYNYSSILYINYSYMYFFAS